VSGLNSAMVNDSLPMASGHLPATRRKLLGVLIACRRIACSEIPTSYSMRLHTANPDRLFSTTTQRRGLSERKNPRTADREGKEVCAIAKSSATLKA
jgi:hypothetical protein